MNDKTAAPNRSPTWTLVASLALMTSFLDGLVVTTALPTLRVGLRRGRGGAELAAGDQQTRCDRS
jgi:hypothetical protein